MFCTQCGNPMDENSAFCTRCGSRLKPIAPAQPQAAPPPQQNAVWVLRTQSKHSLTKSETCYVVFFQDKAVLAYLNPSFEKAENARLSQQIKAEGTGFFKGSAAMMRYWADYHKKYYSMPVEAILAEDPSNLALYYRDIIEVLFRSYSESSNFDDDSSSSKDGVLRFSLPNRQTIQLLHKQHDDKSVREMLGRLLGAKLKYKR